ncbi:MAG: hypothetical protein LQ342_005923 [Letrouitia transgressa]|nr:MAG: hypothetical protein LQ342_005923 [Letrouitia transgressa]
MADPIVLKEPLAQTRQRKSVVFSEGATIVDSNGEVTEVNGHSDKASAENHTKDATETTDKSVDEVTDLFKGLAKKKKTKKPKDTEGAGGDGAAPAADGEFDATALKKKKKKKAPKAADGDDFDAKLAEAGVNEDEEGANGAAVEAPIEEGDLEKGTGIWHHNATQPISYPLLLTRFFTLLHNHHPDLLSSGSKSYKIPPPQCLREGNKKTIFANIADICKRIKRTDEHVTLFLFSELGTSGSVDGSRRLVIKGRFQQKQIENVLRRYIGEHTKTYTKRIRGLIHPSRICNLQDVPLSRHRIE